MDEAQGGKQRILDAAVDLLREMDEMEQITVRQIAERAGAAVGAIGYHFGSKEELLATAVWELIKDITEETLRSAEECRAEPEERLRRLLKRLFNFFPHQKKLIEFAQIQAVRQGKMQIPMYVARVLGQVFPDRGEMELRVLALQLVAPLEVAASSLDTFPLYSGVDMLDESSRNRFIDALVDNLTAGR